MMPICKVMPRMHIEKVMLALVCAFGAQNVWAAGSGLGQVILLKTATGAGNAGYVNVRISGVYVTPPGDACSVDTLPTWRFSLENAIGKSTLAMLLTAQSQGQAVAITGLGTCDGASPGVGRETLSTVQIVP